MNNLNLEKMPVGQLLFKLSTPSMTGLIANALYMIISGIYLGKFVGPEALGGVAIATPIQMILFAFALLFGTGGGILLSVAYGAKENSKVKKIISSTIIFGVITYITLCILVFIFIEPILITFGGTGTILEHSKIYLFPFLLFFTFQGLALIYKNFLWSNYNSIMPMISMISGAIINILLGYIFIPVLKMGTLGASLAAGIAETFGFIILFIFIKAKAYNLKVTFNKFTVSFKIFKEVIISGLAAFTNQLAFSLRDLVLNILALKLGGENAIIMIGIITRLDSFVVIPVFGIMHGLRPIVSYAYGNNNYNRIKNCLKISLISATIFLTTMFILILTLTPQIVGIFINKIELILRIVGIKQVDNHNAAHTDEEIRLLVEDSYEQGLIDETEMQFVDNVIDFSDTRIVDIMIPKEEMVMVKETDSIKLINEMILKLKLEYTRYPVYSEKDIIGFIHIKDLYQEFLSKEDKSLKEIIRPIRFVPQNALINKVLKTFQKENDHLVIVKDGYGSIVGMATMEDILEEIVGEIDDEFDIENQ